MSLHYSIPELNGVSLLSTSSREGGRVALPLLPSHYPGLWPHHAKIQSAPEICQHEAVRASILKFAPGIVLPAL